MSHVEEFYRQGDLLFRRIPKLPSNTQSLKTDIVAEGETTGHKHRLQGNAQLYQFADEKYVSVTGRAELVHEEHKKITLEDGVYAIIQEREFNPFTSSLFKQEQRVQYTRD